MLLLGLCCCVTCLACCSWNSQKQNKVVVDRESNSLNEIKKRIKVDDEGEQMEVQDLEHIETDSKLVTSRNTGRASYKTGKQSDRNALR